MTNGNQPSPLWPADNPAVTAHVALLQGIINRLANNSTSCKTWCLTLTGAFLSLAGAAKQPAIVTFAIVPIAVFGFVDLMYLANERAYRNLYKTIVEKIRNGSYVKADAFEARATWTCADALACIKSWSIWPVYGALIAAYIVVEATGWVNLLAATPVPKP